MNHFQLVPTTYILWMNKEKCLRSNHLIIHYYWKQIFCPNSSSFYGNFCNMTITEVYYAAQSHAMKKPGYNTGRPSYLQSPREWRKYFELSEVRHTSKM